MSVTPRVLPRRPAVVPLNPKPIKPKKKVPATTRNVRGARGVVNQSSIISIPAPEEVKDQRKVRKEKKLQEKNEKEKKMSEVKATAWIVGVGCKSSEEEFECSLPEYNLGGLFGNYQSPLKPIIRKSRHVGPKKEDVEKLNTECTKLGYDDAVKDHVKAIGAESAFVQHVFKQLFVWAMPDKKATVKQVLAMLFIGEPKKNKSRRASKLQYILLNKPENLKQFVRPEKTDVGKAQSNKPARRGRRGYGY
ncbi:hypothetical protein QTN25_001437 [Entamoeba marina]